MFLLFFCVSSSGAILFFCVQVYTSIFLKTEVELPAELVDTVTIYSTLALFPLTIFSGWLSDKVGRKPVILSGLVLGAIFIQPAFYFLDILGQRIFSPDLFNAEGMLILGILIGLSAILALIIGPQSAVLAEFFPAKSRNSAATLPHNLAAGWIGGLLPLIVAWLNQTLSSSTAGLWYPTFFLACASLIAFIYLPETKKISLRD
jgi:MFS family permease